MRSMLAIICCVCLGPSVVALAQSSANEAEYRQIVGDALAEYSRGNWAESRALFDKAHAIYPNARTLRGIGLTAFEMREYVEALNSFRGALEHAERPLSSEQRDQVAKMIERTLTFVARYTLEVSPENAIVLVNNEPPQRESDGTVILRQGEHEISVQADGYETYTRRVNARWGQEETVSIPLESLATYAFEVTPAGATVLVDGKPMSDHVAADASDGGIRLARGEHFLSVALEGYDDYDLVLDVQNGQSVTLAIELERAGLRAMRQRQKRKRIIGWSAVGLGVAGGAAALVIGLQAHSIYNDLSANCTLGPSMNNCPEEVFSDVDKGKKLAETSTILSGAAAAVAITGAVVLLTARQDPEEALAVSGYVTPQSVGASLILRY